MKYTAKQDITMLDALAAMFKEASKTTLRNLLKSKRVIVKSQVVVRAGDILEKGQTLLLEKKGERSPHGLTLIYKDEHIIAIDKPIGLLSVPMAESDEPSALSILRDFFRSTQIFAPHRLDRDTSGAMVFSRSKVAHVALKAMFESHDFVREYTAIVDGMLESKRGTWQSNLVEVSEHKVVSTQTPNTGKLAITNYQILDQNGQATLLQLNLESGRRHQIRVHCNDAGHPVIGDRRYNQISPKVARMCLHASKLAFAHPVTKKPKTFVAPMPALMKGILKKTGLNALSKKGKN